MNNKGFTLIEVMLSLSIVSFFILLIIGIPTGILREYKDYTQVSQIVIEENTLRSAMSKDLKALDVSLEGELLTIGDTIYEFNNDGVYRKEGASSKLKLTSNPYAVEISNEILTINNIDSQLKYNVGSSFKRYYSKEAVKNER